MIKIYADGSDLAKMIQSRNVVSGFTTNPTLMRKAGITNYENFAKTILQQISDVPISFEVIADEIQEMERQAQKLASFGNNVYVKIPITNTAGVSTNQLIKSLLNQHIKVNVTAVLTIDQIRDILKYMYDSTQAILSIFAGRIADTGVDPKPIIKEALELASPNVEILWASCREIYNVYEAKAIGCHIITVPYDLIDKLSLHNKDLTAYSLETVNMFYNDAKNSGLVL